MDNAAWFAYSELGGIFWPIKVTKVEIKMKVLVDADACPVRHIVEEVAKEFNLKVIMIIDSSHILQSDYSEIITVAQGKDAVDLALINRTEANDIVVTQDYGVAALALGKHAFAINQNGLVYTDDNIDQMLFERHISQRIRRQGGRTCSLKKRTDKDDERFRKKFRALLLKALRQHSDKNIR